MSTARATLLLTISRRANRSPADTSRSLRSNSSTLTAKSSRRRRPPTCLRRNMRIRSQRKRLGESSNARANMFTTKLLSSPLPCRSRNAPILPTSTLWQADPADLGASQTRVAPVSPLSVPITRISAFTRHCKGEMVARKSIELLTGFPKIDLAVVEMPLPIHELPSRVHGRNLGIKRRLLVATIASHARRKPPSCSSCGARPKLCSASKVK